MKQQLQHPNPVLRGNNELTLSYLGQVQKCVNTLNEMGLHVINIHFEKIKPTVRVQPSAVTKSLESKNEAICYLNGSDGSRYGEYQIMIEGIRVVWRSYLN